MLGQIEEEIAAMNIIKKNNIPISHPNGIFAKTYGNVTKASPGPCVGGIPNENTDGIIAILASIATAVSAMAVNPAVLNKLSVLREYEA